MDRIGLIAGNRKFPLLFCEAAKKRGLAVVAVAIKGETSRQITRLAERVHWLNLGEYSRLFEIFKAENITRLVMAGQISPRRLLTREINLDPNLREILATIKDKRADTIFGEIARRIKDAGFELLDSTLFLGEHLPAQGTLTRREPGFREWEDVYFGFEIAKEMGLLDIGQTVAVKDRIVVAVEAFEGTDHLIRRAGKLSRGGMTVVKVSKPKQDMRFDIPVIGPGTIKSLIKARAACLAIESGKTLFIDRTQALRLAERHNLAVVAV